MSSIDLGSCLLKTILNVKCNFDWWIEKKGAQQGEGCVVREANRNLLFIVIVNEIFNINHK